MMKTLWKNLVSLFTKTFLILEEHKQATFIQSIGLDDNGYTIIDATPVGSDQACTFFPHQILSTPCIAKQFIPADIKLIKGMLTAEGDIFIDAKEYSNNDEIYSLRSLLNDEKWQLTREQIETQKQIFNRVNKRFFYFLLRN